MVSRELEGPNQVGFPDIAVFGAPCHLSCTSSHEPKVEKLLDTSTPLLYTGETWSLNPLEILILSWFGESAPTPILVCPFIYTSRYI